MDNKKDITTVDTNGKILHRGKEGVGVRILSEDGVFIMDIGEVSDDEVIDIFFTMDEPRGFNSIPDSSEQGTLPPKFDILLKRPEKTG